MISDIKLLFKLMKYAPLKKSSFTSMVIFAAMGFVQIFAFDNPTSKKVGMLMFAVIPFLIAQFFSFLAYSQLVAASPKKKDIMVRMNVLGIALSELMAYAILYVCISMLYKNGYYEYDAFCNFLAFFGIALGAGGLYYIFCFKYFVASLVIFLTMAYGVIGVSNVTHFLEAGYGLTQLSASLMGLGIIFVFIMITYAAAKLIYKKPLDPLAMGTLLRSNM